MLDDRIFRRHWNTTARGMKFAHTTFCWNSIQSALPIQQRIQAGFDVDLLGAIEKMQWAAP